MNKKCVICGIELDENAPVCPKCGTLKPTEATDPPLISPKRETPKAPTLPTESVAPKAPAPEVPTAPQKPATKKSKALPWILGGGAVALIAVVILFFGLFDSMPTPEPSAPPTLIDNSLALMNGDLNVLEQMAPEEYWEYSAQKSKLTKDQYLATRKNTYSMQFQERDKTHGFYNVSGEIISEADTDAESLQKIADALFVRYGILQSSVTAGKELMIQWSVTTASKSWTIPPEVLSAVEIDGSWYLITWVALEEGQDITFFFY